MIKNLNIWKKFFLGFMVITAVLVFISAQVTLRQYYNNVKQQGEIKLNDNLDSFKRQLYRRLDNVFLIVKFISNDCSLNYSFKEALESNNLLVMQKLLKSYKEQNNLSFVIITDPSGKIIASSNNKSSAGEKINNHDTFSKFMDGKAQKGIIVLDEHFIDRENLQEQAHIKIIPTPEARPIEKIEEKRGLALVASIPFYNEENEFIATLIGGELLNRQFLFIDEVTDALQVAATIFLDDLRIATSIRLDNGERAIGTRVSEEVAKVVLDRGERYLGRAFILDQWYLTAYDPLLDDNNKVIGSIYVGIPEAPFLQMRKEIVDRYLWATIFSIVLAMVIAYFITNSITNPIHSLIKTMQKVENGDLSQRFKKNTAKSWPVKETPKKVGDEIQLLGCFFNKMMESLQSNWQKNQELQVQLEEKEKKLLHLLKKIINTQEEERKRISRELHDETGQSLTGLLLGLKLIQESEDFDKAKKIAGNLREIAHKTLEDIQWLSFELRPSVLDDLGLFPALNRYFKEISRYSGLNIEFEQKDCKDLRFGPVVETTIYRVAQEALTNVIRHAEAKNVRVMLYCKNKAVEVIIEDDGKGFDFNAIKNNEREALGLFGMKERASLIDGELIIDTAIGKGTKVILRIPDIEKLKSEV